MSLKVTLHAPAKNVAQLLFPGSQAPTCQCLEPSGIYSPAPVIRLMFHQPTGPKLRACRKLLSHALLGMWYEHESGAFAMRIVLGSPIYASISRIPTQGKSKIGKPPTCAVRFEFSTRQEQDWKTSDLRGAVQISCWQVLATQVRHFQG